MKLSSLCNYHKDRGLVGAFSVIVQLPRLIVCSTSLECWGLLFKLAEYFIHKIDDSEVYEVNLRYLGQSSPRPPAWRPPADSRVQRLHWSTPPRKMLKKLRRWGRRWPAAAASPPSPGSSSCCCRLGVVSNSVITSDNVPAPPLLWRLWSKVQSDWSVAICCSRTSHAMAPSKLLTHSPEIPLWIWYN